MLTQASIENKLQGIKQRIVEKYFVDKIGYFGSFSRNEQNANSDVDIIVSFKKPLGWEFFDLKDLLENELQTKVDLVSINAIKDQLRESILKEVKYI